MRLVTNGIYSNNACVKNYNNSCIGHMTEIECFLCIFKWNKRNYSHKVMICQVSYEANISFMYLKADYEFDIKVEILREEKREPARENR